MYDGPAGREQVGIVGFAALGAVGSVFTIDGLLETTAWHALAAALEVFVLVELK